MNKLTGQKGHYIIHQVTTMLATSKNVLFPEPTTCKTPVLMTLHFNYQPSMSEGDN